MPRVEGCFGVFEGILQVSGLKGVEVQGVRVVWFKVASLLRSRLVWSSVFFLDSHIALSKVVGPKPANFGEGL